MCFTVHLNQTINLNYKNMAIFFYVKYSFYNKILNGTLVSYCSVTNIPKVGGLK